MVSDSTFSYIHMDNQSYLMFVENWENQKLRWDDIEIVNGDVLQQHDNLLQQFLSQNDEQETDISIMNSNNPMFNASYANRTKQKNKKLNWKDVDLNTFNPKINEKNQIHDLTILKKPNLGDNFNFDYDNMNFDLLNGNNNINNDIINDDTFRQYGMNSEEEFDIDTDNIILNRKISNPDISKSFSYQFNTPIVNNKISIQNTSHQSISQQRRQTSDPSNRNISYNTPGHRNIR